MCTAATYQTDHFYFGRNLDYEHTLGEEVVITPRRYPLPMRCGAAITQHYAMIGIAHVRNGYPLYYDACNEKGLCAAGLQFPNYAVYPKHCKKDSIAIFEFIPWLLGCCADLHDVRKQLSGCHLVDLPFCAALPTTPLHWIVADKSGCLVLEPTSAGLQCYENKVGVLTNSPPFPLQEFALNPYMKLSPHQPENDFAPELPLDAYSRGMGAIGLPGDFSSQSRFIRAAFVRANAKSPSGELESVAQFFHILSAAEQPRGCCYVDDTQMELTHYTSCCSAERGIYYYSTYENRQLTAVYLHPSLREHTSLLRYPLVRQQQIRREN